MSRRIMALVLLTAAACRREAQPPPPADCGSCHATEVAALARSHHARGQALATPQTVPEGDVGGFRVRHEGAAVVIGWRDDAGERSGRARYTLGVDPLVQLAVETPTGSLQVPPIGWQPDGGWRTVPTLPGAAGDWRTPSFNWNGGCAPCHATGFRVGLTPEGRFESTWSSLSVSCEACHGDASGHRRWLAVGRPADGAAGFQFSLRTRVDFSLAPDASIAQATDGGVDVQTGVCGACHSRRRALVDDRLVSASLLDRFEPALLSTGLYHPDGRIADEVYETGSFLMSRMQRAGVRCSHCHEPHGGTLRADGNALCGQCHRGAVFDTSEHREGAAETSCIACHMPTLTVLGVDVRHDHAFRRPSSRPTPLETATTAAFEALFTERVDASWRWRAAAADPRLSSFERASALAVHSGGWSQEDLSVLERAIRDGDDWERFGAAKALPTLPPALRVQRGTPLLRDPRRAVRVQSARSLSGLVALPASVRAELLEAERVNAFRGEAWLNSSALAASPADAARLLRLGLERDPTFVPLLINLADLERDAGVPWLETAASQPGSWQPAAAYALGLARWREGDREGARAAFELASTDGSATHLSAWCLAEREGRGAQAGWRALDAALLRSPGKRALLDLGLDWAVRDGERAREVALRAEARRWLR